MRIATLDEHLIVFVRCKRTNTIKCPDNGVRAKYMSCYFYYYNLFEEFLNYMKNSIIII